MREREKQRAIDRGPDWDGEELVDGTAGGTENVIDVTHETPDTGRRIMRWVVVALAILLLAVPVVWAAGMLTSFGGAPSSLSGPLELFYLSLFLIFGISAAYWAYAVLLRVRAA